MTPPTDGSVRAKTMHGWLRNVEHGCRAGGTLRHLHSTATKAYYECDRCYTKVTMEADRNADQ